MVNFVPDWLWKMLEEAWRSATTTYYYVFVVSCVVGVVLAILGVYKAFKPVRPMPPPITSMSPAFLSRRSAGGLPSWVSPPREALDVVRVGGPPEEEENEEEVADNPAPRPDDTAKRIRVVFELRPEDIQNGGVVRGVVRVENAHKISIEEGEDE